MWKIESITANNGYFYARVPKHPKATSTGYVYLHRILMENHLGRLLGKDEVVHHKNEDRGDNRLENLQLMTFLGHAVLHGQKYKTELLQLLCDYCGKEFSRQRHQRAEVKKYTNSFCSRSCNGKYQRAKQLKPQ